MSRTSTRAQHTFTPLFGLRPPRGLDGDQLAEESRRDAAHVPLFLEVLSRSGDAWRDRTAGLAADLAALPQPLTLVSLARGGIPLGHVLQSRLAAAGVDVVHLALAFDRARGLEPESVTSAGQVARHRGGTLVVVDGWTGSGQTMEIVRRHRWPVPFVTAALSDPVGACDLAGTTRDALVPHALLFQELCHGIGRPQWIDDRFVAAVGRTPRTTALDTYVDRLAGHGAGPVVGAPPVARPDRAQPSHDGPPRTDGTRILVSAGRRTAHGISECWRAFLLGRLVSLEIVARADPDADLADLVNRVGSATVVGRLGSHACRGRVRA